MKQLIIFGTEDYAKIVYEYFSCDSEYEVIAFTADKAYCKSDKFLGLPLVPFEEVQAAYPPAYFDMHIAVVYGQMNRLRALKCSEAKAKGYKLASYISSNAFVWKNAKIGEHCFIFEDNTIQPFTEIGDNCILWS